ncbi:PLD nuclease N-terminal domain-containing protein [Micromonospora sp. WMMD882]|uniref:PLD nuclease N-terminal domain-containing protein n=1 Tax=Micromonospora sp. WMMD882 TaxID=3015151 RepID=UPI00248AD679|nr:PLD nuclease N-terminal domain-containing protein [Micromonospora sp. WMMD882]WBB82056.1 PLD nuclease N-terminal domain-containing protein [Micromonospora sp. WMMD882]
MVRVFLLLFVIQVVLASLALIDCLSTDKHKVRGAPRFVWVLAILLVPLLGAAGWFVAGRPVRAGDAPRPAAPRRGPVAPDDNPEFLKSLDESTRKQDEELFRRWEEDLRRREEKLRDPDPTDAPDRRPEPGRADTTDRRPDPDQTA